MIPTPPQSVRPLKSPVTCTKTYTRFLAALIHATPSFSIKKLQGKSITEMVHKDTQLFLVLMPLLLVSLSIRDFLPSWVFVFGFFGGFRFLMHYYNFSSQATSISHLRYLLYLVSWGDTT